MCCIVLNCVALFCIALYSNVLNCIVLFCIVLYCTSLFCIVLHCTSLYCIVFTSKAGLNLERAHVHEARCLAVGHTCFAGREPSWHCLIMLIECFIDKISFPEDATF